MAEISLDKRCEYIEEVFSRKIDLGLENGADADQMREWYEERQRFGTWGYLALQGMLNQGGIYYVGGECSIMERIYVKELLIVVIGE